jgi:hypothetical protein
LMADVEAIGRLISLALRSGVPLPEIYRQLRGISSDRAVGLGPHKVLSVPDAIGIAIEKWMQDKQGVQQDLLDSTRASTAAPAEVVPGGAGDAALRADRSSHSSRDVPNVTSAAFLSAADPGTTPGRVTPVTTSPARGR